MCQAWARLVSSADGCGGLFVHGGDEVADRDGGEADVGVADAVRDEQHIVVAKCAARVHDVRYVPVLLIELRGQQWLSGPADDLRRSVEVEKQRADRVRAHWPDAVGEHEPAVVGFDR